MTEAQRSLWPFEMTAAEFAYVQCGKADEADVSLNWVSVCDPGGQPITGWLHRDCEAAFLRGRK